VKLLRESTDVFVTFLRAIERALSERETGRNGNERASSAAGG